MVGLSTDGYSLDFGVRVLDREVVEEEHAVEGLHEELNLDWISPMVCSKSRGQAKWDAFYT